MINSLLARMMGMLCILAGVSSRSAYKLPCSLRCLSSYFSFLLYRTSASMYSSHPCLATYNRYGHLLISAQRCDIRNLYYQLLR